MQTLLVICDEQIQTKMQITEMWSHNFMQNRCLDISSLNISNP
jgi:hypothetical protein